MGGYSLGAKKKKMSTRDCTEELNSLTFFKAMNETADVGIIYSPLWLRRLWPIVLYSTDFEPHSKGRASWRQGSIVEVTVHLLKGGKHNRKGPQQDAAPMDLAMHILQSGSTSQQSIQM